MKKILVYSFALLLIFASVNSAYAIQTKSSDYVIIKDSAETKNQVIPVQPSKYVPTYDSITEMGEYLKVKKDGKYGVIDKNANIILAPVFQRVSIVEIEGKKCIAAKADGKYRFYYNTGKLVPEDKIYSVRQNTSILLAKDLKPQFKTAIKENYVTYTKLEEEPADNSFVYEIQEIPIVKNVQVAYVEKNAEAQQNNKAEILEEKQDNNLFTIGKKQFYIVSKGDKIGITNTENSVIIPAKYDAFTIQTPCSHFKNPVFIVSKDNAFTIYDIKGKILAEQVYDKINVYKQGSVYSYIVENNIGILTKNGKQIGIFEKTSDDYKYTPTKFSIFKPHIVNNLIISMLNVANL